MNYANQTPYQVAVIAGNMELADVIKNYQPDEVGEFRGCTMYMNILKDNNMLWLILIFDSKKPFGRFDFHAFWGFMTSHAY